MKGAVDKLPLCSCDFLIAFGDQFFSASGSLRTTPSPEQERPAKWHRTFLALPHQTRGHKMCERNITDATAADIGM